MNTYNTADVLYADRSEYWQHAISHTFVPLESTFSGSERQGVLRSGVWGDLRLSEVSSSAQDVVRCRRGAGNHPDNAMLLSFISQGKTSVIQAGSHVMPVLVRVNSGFMTHASLTSCTCMVKRDSMWCTYPQSI